MIVFFLFFSIGWAGVSHESSTLLVDQLHAYQIRILDIEKGLLTTLKSQKLAKSNLQKIKTLMELQRQEHELTKKRLQELEFTVQELEKRRETLRARIGSHQLGLRKNLKGLLNHDVSGLPKEWMEREKFEAPRRKLMADLSSRTLKEVEAYRVDLLDSEQLGVKIQEEKQQLNFLMQELNEKESVLELNRQLQVDLFQKNYQDRIAQFENYKKLKSSESQIESLIQSFNVRKELAEAQEPSHGARYQAGQIFSSLKGSLPLPVQGSSVLTKFGRTFDAQSKLFVFKKGIELGVKMQSPVQAVSDGKVAYVGEMPSYGRVVILDHGDHFYTLIGRLGLSERKVGDLVKAGDLLGKTDDAGSSVYFEIRSRNVAVNPLTWIR